MPRQYVGYIKTLNDHAALLAGDRVALKIVASTWENEQGRFWAAYHGDGEKSNAEIADHGAKLKRELAEQLFPQIVAKGYEWWD